MVLEEEAIDFDVNTKAVDSLSLRRASRTSKRLSKQEYPFIIPITLISFDQSRYSSFETEFSNEVAKVELFFKSRHDKFAARLHELTQEIDLMVCLSRQLFFVLYPFSLYFREVALQVHL